MGCKVRLSWVTKLALSLNIVVVAVSIVVV